MIGFIVGAILLVVFSVALVVWPLYRRPASADFSRAQLNAAIYRDQLAELERDRSEGALSQADYDQACAELQRRLLEDTAAEPEAATQTVAPDRMLPIVLALALPLGAVLFYLGIGNPRAIDPPPPEKQFTQADIERMVTGLAAKLEKEPGNLKGWVMLARSYKAMGRYDDAVRAYERGGELVSGDPDLLVDYADAVVAVSGEFDKKATGLIDRALKLDPANMQGLWLRGTAAFRAKQFDKAIADWEALRKLLPPDSEEAKVVAGNIEEARGLKTRKK